MPVSPADGARYGRQVAGIINQAEITLLRILADTLRKGDPAEENWVADRLAEIQRLRARMVRTATELDVHMADHIRTVILQAYNVGSSLAVKDLDKHGIQPSLIPDPAAAIEVSAVQTAQDVHAAIRRTPDMLASLYRQAVEAGAADVLGGGSTRMQGSQSVLDALANDGITGFVDTAGRNWSLDTFAEMAVRTATARAAVAGHVATLQASGVDLVIISESGGSCPLCEPWEGKILSSSGDVAGGIFPDVTGGDDTSVDVAGSLDDATDAGLFHPNCTHTADAYLPGATDASDDAGDAPTATELDDAQSSDGSELYQATQAQRGMERSIRQWKRRQAVALDDSTAAKASAKVGQWQAALRDLVDRDDLRRLSSREQIGRAH